jgi:hypothetical protein
MRQHHCSSRRSRRCGHGLRSFQSIRRSTDGRHGAAAREGSSTVVPTSMPATKKTTRDLIMQNEIRRMYRKQTSTLEFQSYSTDCSSSQRQIDFLDILKGGGGSQTASEEVGGPEGSACMRIAQPVARTDERLRRGMLQSKFPLREVWRSIGRTDRHELAV